MGDACPYGHVICAIPDTFMVMALICEIGIVGSTGAVASTVAIPTKPLHCARPLASTVGDPEDMELDDIVIGMGIAGNGLPMLHITGGEATVIGAMLNVAVAMNWTCPPGNFCASAEAGVT